MSDSPWLDLALVAGFGALGWLSWRKLKVDAQRYAPELDVSDFVVFEAKPDQLSGLEADLQASGWRLAESKARTTDTKLYRFEKEGESSVSLAALLIGRELSKRARQRRHSGPPIKIKAHGLRTERHA